MVAYSTRRCFWCPCSGHVWGGGTGEEDPHQAEEEGGHSGAALLPTTGDHSGAALRPPQLVRLCILPLQWLQGAWTTDCKDVWRVVIVFIFNLSVWNFRVGGGFQPMDRNIHRMSEDDQSPCEPSSTSSSSSSSLSGPFDKQENVDGNPDRKSVFTALPHVTDLVTYMIQDIISFSKSLQDFR